MFIEGHAAFVLWGGAMSDEVHLTLYSRSYCHLCDDMLTALTPLLQIHGGSVSVVDVDEHDDLVALYDELVPVLVGQRGDCVPEQLCHYFLDKVAVEAFLVKN
jgi:thiol-disulfide isomerase/thioredoxin